MLIPASPRKFWLPRMTLPHCRYLVLTALLICAGCSGDSEPAPLGARPSSGGKAAPQITATPNPVPADSTTTTITWDTGDGTAGEVYVSPNGAAEKRFAGARKQGSQDATWIRQGEYEFRLYAGKEHKTMLASVKVTRAKSN